MKKSSFILASSALAFLLVGCKDATTKLNDSNTAVLSIGKTTITKGELYSMMLSSVGSSAAIDAVENVYLKEVQITDEINKEVEDTLNNYKTLYSSEFENYLNLLGLTEDEYKTKYILNPKLEEESIKNYINENFDSYVEKNKPVKAIVLTFDNGDSADKALEQLKADTNADVAKIAQDNGSTSSAEPQLLTTSSTSVDTVALTTLQGAKPEDGWVKSPTTTDSIVLFKVVSNNVNEFKDEFVSTLQSNSQVSSDAKAYYFKKYGFHIYDINLLNQFKAQNPNLVNQ